MDYGSIKRKIENLSINYTQNFIQYLIHRLTFQFLKFDKIEFAFYHKKLIFMFMLFSTTFFNHHILVNEKIKNKIVSF